MKPDINTLLQNWNSPKTLLIGIGNSGKSDDGLGWAFLNEIKKDEKNLARVVHRYQLQIEDADLIKEFETVIFIDAYRGELEEGFELKICQSLGDFSFTTHELNPETILALCRNLFEKSPNAFVLLIQGNEWGLNIGLSESAEKNLKGAVLKMTGNKFQGKKLLGNTI